MSMQMAELHYQTSPSINTAEIVERAESLIHSGVELVDGKEQEESAKALLFIHKKHIVEYQAASVPAQTAIILTAKHSAPESYAKEIQQSWGCRNARERIQASTASRLVTEMMAHTLAPEIRVELFHGVLQAFVEMTKPHAILFKHSQQVIAPEDYLQSCANVGIQRLGAINVRFFRISNSDTEDMIMDTRGMEEIGLHDLQCHFRQLKPDDVSYHLLNIALYIFQNGPVIQSGHTIPGIEPGTNWKCQFENALVEPEREILDLNPGEPFAAGERS